MVLKEGSNVVLTEDVSQDFDGVLKPGAKGIYHRTQYGLHNIEVNGRKFWLKTGEFRRSVRLPNKRKKVRRRNRK